MNACICVMSVCTLYACIMYMWMNDDVHVISVYVIDVSVM